MRWRPKVWAFICVALVLSGTSVPDEKGMIQLKRVVIFGDSLSDTGNTLQLFEYLRGNSGKPWFFDDLFTPGWTLLPIRLFVGRLPPKGYYNGRFSNGPLACELAVDMLGLNTHDPEQYANLAFGGSWTVSSWQFMQSWMGLWKEPTVNTTQLIQHMLGGLGKWVLPSTYELAHWYLQKHKVLDPDALYVMSSGSNDYQNGFWDVEAIVTTQTSIIEQLILKGARHIGWGTLPDLTFTPCFHGSSSVSRILKTVESHNKLITAVKRRLEGIYPQVKITFADGYSAMKLFFQNAEKFGFKVTERGCSNIIFPGCYKTEGVSILNVGDNEMQVCEKPEEYFFWDAMHPTTRAYEHMATYLCVLAGLEGYWTNCRLPRDFNKTEAEKLMNLLIDGGIPNNILPGREQLERLLNL